MAAAAPASVVPAPLLVYRHPRLSDALNGRLQQLLQEHADWLTHHSVYVRRGRAENVPARGDCMSLVRFVLWRLEEQLELPHGALQLPLATLGNFPRGVIADLAKQQQQRGLESWVEMRLSAADLQTGDLVMLKRFIPTEKEDADKSVTHIAMMITPTRALHCSSDQAAANERGRRWDDVERLWRHYRSPTPEEVNAYFDPTVWKDYPDPVACNFPGPHAHVYHAKGHWLRGSTFWLPQGTTTRCAWPQAKAPPAAAEVAPAAGGPVAAPIQLAAVVTIGAEARCSEAVAATGSTLAEMQWPVQVRAEEDRVPIPMPRVHASEL